MGSMGRRSFTPRRQTAFQAITGEVCSRKGSQQRRRHQRRLKKLAARGAKQAGSSEQGARVICGMYLDGLSTRSTAGSGHGAWETRQCEPPRSAVVRRTISYWVEVRSNFGKSKSIFIPLLTKAYNNYALQDSFYSLFYYLELPILLPILLPMKAYINCPWPI
jgi:hypothetical protein